MEIRHPERRGETLLALAMYTAITGVFFGRFFVGSLSDRCFGHIGDPGMFMWYLKFWDHALTHHLNPFLTDLIWAPTGFNLAWSTSIPLVGVLSIPLQRTLGLVATYNLILLAAPVLAAWCTFLLCRELSCPFWPAFFGGYVFGFSAYMLGHLAEHICLALIFPIPLLALLAVRRFEGRLGASAFVAFFALTGVAQFLTSVEIFALAAVVSGLAFTFAFLHASGEMRTRLFALSKLTVVASGVTALAVSPCLYYMLAFGFPSHPIRPAGKYSIDLLNLIVPSAAMAVGRLGWIARISVRFTADIDELSGFIGPVLMLVVLGWLKRHRSEPIGRTLGLTMAAILVLALGPAVMIAGRGVFPTPWLIVERLPLIGHALPSRLMAFEFLIVAVITARWLAESGPRPSTKAAAAICAALLMLPNPSRNFWIEKIATPAFFTDGSSERYLGPADIVLLLPNAERAMSMLWQAEAGMGFRQVLGYAGFAPFRVARWPMMRLFLGAPDLPEPDQQFKAFLARMGATAVVVDDHALRGPEFNRLASTLGVEPIRISGVSLYRIPPGFLDKYRGMTGLMMERRAAMLKFDAAVKASDSFLEGGHAVGSLSDHALAEAGLLPRNWLAENIFPDDPYRDMVVGPVGGRSENIGIALVGSKEAMAPLMEEAAPYADTIFYPAPKVWWTKRQIPWTARVRNWIFTPEPASATYIEGTFTMAVVLTPANLHALAVELRSGTPRTVSASRDGR